MNMERELYFDLYRTYVRTLVRCYAVFEASILYLCVCSVGVCMTIISYSMLFVYCTQ